MKSFALLSAALTLSLACSAATPVDFNKHFADSTLRLDYIFSGGMDKTDISLDELIKFPEWAGRRHHLNEIPLLGNGQLTVTSLAGDTLYRASFSTLFQEWLVTDEAQTKHKAFEHTALVPFPKETVNVSITLLDARHKQIATLTHSVDPTDILIKTKTVNPETRYTHKGGDVKDAIDVAILAEGYTEAEVETFFADAQKATESVLSHSPFKETQDKFNFIAVFTPSKDSGVSIPRFNDWKKTAFSSHFSTFYSDRYLTSLHVHDIHDAIAGLPYEHLIILANTDEYGGGGIYNSYTLTTAHHRNFWPVVTHEFGHSFGGLGDEYFYETDVMTDTYPTDVEPWEPNITTLLDFDSKWADILPKGTPVPTAKEDAEKYPIGVFEGGGYSFKGIYRPAFNCRMRTNEHPEFCPACQSWLTKLINFYTAE
jgi:hypothetical protein